MTSFVSQSSPFGSVPAVPNAFATADLDTAILQDPVKIVAFKESIAGQMNAQSAGPRIEDLSERISGITLETSAQGASFLTVGVIDPAWVLACSGFIQVDDTGYLWPPIDINFPTGTDCVWRLCALDLVWDADMGSDPNVTLTFEDRIASFLREMSSAIPGGLAQGQPNQTLGGFFKQLVDNTNSVLKLTGSERIRLVEMISPQDPNYTLQINDLPASAYGALRKNPLKSDRGPTVAQQQQLDAISLAVNQFFQDPTLSIAEGETGLLERLNSSKVNQISREGS